MKLSEALALVQQRQQTGRRRSIFLACGFQPLHLPTFIRAHFAGRFQEEAADVQTGLYGDLGQTLDTAAVSQAEAAAVVIEWADLDPRLGLRSSGGWGPTVEDDILSNCRERYAHLLSKLEVLASQMPVALSLPTLPTPLFGHTTGWQMAAAEADLDRQIATFAADVARVPNVRILQPGRLAQLSPAPDRSDPKMELAAGFPYSLSHASALALQLIHLLYPASPMKGLITDLDDTLWSGIVGEVGVASVSWSVAEHSQVHGLYQQQLKQLSEMGVLMAIASKNDPTVVQDALARQDLYVPRDAFFPVAASWNRKSDAVAEILRVWNVGAESVAYVDDSPMELEEVRTAFPAITCLQFPSSSPAKVIQLLEQLRDLFGKPALNREDSLRLSSIRANADFRKSAGGGSPDAFIKGLQARITFDIQKDTSNKRLLELINKTNQFNLNGERISEGDWLRFLSEPDSFTLGVSYEDKFGPLGVIGVVAGRQTDHRLDVQAWVLSCRAFSRKIEFHILDYLFRSASVEKVALAFKPTERNQPLREFLASLGISSSAAGESVISRDAFLRAAYELPHEVIVTGDRRLVDVGH